MGYLKDGVPLQPTPGGGLLQEGTMWESKKPYVIAEVGSNFVVSDDGLSNKASAISHIKMAKQAGASAVKFQLWTVEDLYGYAAREDLRQWQLPEEWVRVLSRTCREEGMDFILSVFNPAKVEPFSPYVDAFKVASSDFRHLPLLKAMLDIKKPIIMSTGGHHVSDIGKNLEFIAKHDPNLERLCLLECVAAYPAPVKDYNLSTLVKLMVTGVRHVGVSDHTMKRLVSIAAVALGAKVFEYHFDAHRESRNLETPDAVVSLSTSELETQIHLLNQVHAASRDEAKHWMPSEQEFVLKHIRRLKFTCDVPRGTVLKYGVHYGIYRSLEDDPKGGPAEAYKHFDGVTLNQDKKQGDSLWYSDVKGIEDGGCTGDNALGSSEAQRIADSARTRTEVGGQSPSKVPPK